MSERFFRVLLGGALLLMLAMQWDGGVYAMIGLLLFEGITNQRIPLLVSRLRGDHERSKSIPVPARVAFDAERALRLTFAVVLGISFVFFRDLLWFVPWFLGMALFMAGITGVCPVVIAYKRMGFRG